MPIPLFPALETSCSRLSEVSISDERQEILQPLIAYLRRRLGDAEPINLTFICTHNSRRSHLAQVWAQTLAWRLGLYQINCFSGGTEATEVYPQVIETLLEQGFLVERRGADVNPIWWIKASAETPAIPAFSKAYDHFVNPAQRFAALMTCAQADAECPLILGSEQRVALDYQDPKAFDGTPQKAAAYRERSVQIGSELAYVLAQAVKHEA